MPLSQVWDGRTRLRAWTNSSVLNLSNCEVGELVMQRLIYHQQQTSVKLILIGLRSSSVEETIAPGPAVCHCSYLFCGAFIL